MWQQQIIVAADGVRAREQGVVHGQKESAKEKYVFV